MTRKLTQIVIIALLATMSRLCPASLASSQQRPYVFSLEEADLNPQEPLLLIFFNVSCHVCWDELFTWRDFILTKEIRVQLVGITREPEEAVAAFLRKYPVSQPIVIDREGLLFRRYKVAMEPFCLLVRGEKIIYKDNLMEPPERRREKLAQCLLGIN